ncbi:hypothetical protein [Clostridium sp. C8-1-8]|uniref:hypothetical protein n=1 Tax=Clostridium sp. C8-1-8 TaxID=2698831 RepID=UPI00137224EE|nr:hypothetical protein [Clostridium sp. C8-1-8]
MTEGRAVGKAEGMKEIAKNALRKGADISFIVEITGLKEEDVTTLKDEMDNQ